MFEKLFLFITVSLLFTSCVSTTPFVIATEITTPSVISKPTQMISPSRTAVPGITPLPTSIPSLTSTPQPTLVAHEWLPQKVLIALQWTSGDGCCTFPHTPRLILYRDGTMILTRYFEVQGFYRSRILIRKLNQKEICQNLNTLDQMGFLDYDPSTYVFNGEPALEGGGSTTIEVNAWNSNYISFNSLGAYISLEMQTNSVGNGLPVILPALRNAYMFLDTYPEDNFEIYRPDEFGMWVMPTTDLQTPPYTKGLLLGEWPLHNLSLSGLFSHGVSPNTTDTPIRFAKANGVEALDLYGLLESSFGDGDTYYEEQQDGSKKYYYVFIRPILPYEKSNADQTDFTGREFSISNTEMSCDPSDGILPMPILTNP